MPTQAPAIIANLNLAIEGIGKSATCTSFQRPEISHKIETFPGMVADYEAFGNLEALTAEFTLADIDINAIELLSRAPKKTVQGALKYIGAAGDAIKNPIEGIGLISGIKDALTGTLSSKMLTLYGSLQQGGKAVSLVCYMRGRAKKRTTNAFKPNEKLEETFSLSLDFYQEVRDHSTIIKIDLFNNILQYGGTNYYADHNLNIGK